MAPTLKNAAELESIPVGYTWESPLIRASFWRAIFFALACGDWNKFHINPFTLPFFKSNLGGMTCPGDMVLAATKKGIHDVFQFEEHTELIAFGYQSVDFKRPLRVRSFFRYRFVLLDREIDRGKAKCRWSVEVLTPDGKMICSGVWTMGYHPVGLSSFGTAIARTIEEKGRVGAHLP